MKKSLHATLIYHQQILAEKTITSSKVTLGSAKNNDFTVDAADLSSSYTVFEKDVVRLRPQMLASLSSAGHLYPVGTPRHGTKSGEVETFEFTESDWLILNLSPGLDFVLCYKSDELPPFIPASPVLTLSQALESPVARALVLSFALHSAFILLTSLASDPEDAVHVKALETRWVELISEVSERQEEEKEDVPVIEDVDNVIVDDAMKDFDRPKIDDTKSDFANLNKVEKPVGLQAALGGAKLHDMESLFGSTAGLGDALDFMPETEEGDAFGTGAGFAAGLTGIGFGGGGGGGGGGYGSGIGGMGGGGGGGGNGAAKVKGPKKSNVKQKTKLAMEAPKQGAFCKESNIRDVVQKRSNALRNCYEQQLLANPDLSGKIIVFWKIGLDGKVTDASIKSTTMNNARVESCLTTYIRKLTFDKPDGGICVVEFPFIFSAAQ